jgi:hypothetical protein
MKILDNLDLSKSALQNAAIQALGTSPTSPVTGQIYFDTVANAIRFYDGSGWTNKATDALLLGGNTSAYHLARGNHSGTQTASTISDLASVVQAYRLDQFAVPTGAVSFNGQRLTNVADPSSGTDAANQQYVLAQLQSAAAGIDSKPSVRVAATSNITLSGTQTIDGVSVIVGDRVLAASQTTTSQNGVYVVASGAWSRATDADQTGEITPGAFWYVEEGTAYGKTQWRCNNTGTITLGTTGITIYQFGAANIYSAGNGLSLTGGVFAVTPKSLGGLVVDGTGLYIDTSIVASKFSATIGDGAATSIVVTHNLNTRDITVSVRDFSTNEGVWTTWTANTVNQVTLTFRTAPSLNGYRVTVTG